MGVNFISVRIDDRLIHGQGAAWLSTLPINMVIVANDEVANSQLEQDLMLAMVPGTIEPRFFTIQKLIDVIHKAADHQKIFLIFRTLKDVERAIDGGVPINSLNIGNIRKKNGTTNISPYVNFIDDEYRIIKKLLKLGIELNSKQTPMGDAKDEHINFEKIVANK